MLNGEQKDVIYPIYKIIDLASKILAICIRNGLMKAAGQLLGKYQTGFKSSRSTTDKIFILK